MSKNKISLTLGIVCLVLTIAIVMQIKTINSANSTVSKSFTENSLRDDVLKWKEKYENISKEQEKVDEALKIVRKEATKDNQNSEEIEKSIRENNNLIGLTDIEGQGIVITVTDDPNATRETISYIDDISNHLVHYFDLITIVNELKNAGAEAISINGQRIVSTTSINCIGNVIKINDEKVNSPFEIKAIGLSESLVSLDRPGSYIERMRFAGIVVNIKKESKVEIPKYTGLISSKYMK